MVGFVVVPLGRDGHGRQGVGHLPREGEVAVAAAELSRRGGAQLSEVVRAGEGVVLDAVEGVQLGVGRRQAGVVAQVGQGGALATGMLLKKVKGFVLGFLLGF